MIAFLTVGLIGLFCTYMIWRHTFHKPQFAEPPIKLYLSEENQCITLSLEDYVTGTVAAEMPASFETEALKAQAVAARTYTLVKLLHGAQYPMGAQLSDDTNTCQAYISPERFQEIHSLKNKKLWSKIAQAVKATRGEVMLYQGELVDALYHSTCGGRTASALEAWGKDIPYLQSVSCDFCKESKNYNITQLYKYSDMDPDMKKIVGNKPVVHILEKASSGRIEKIQINQHIYSGEAFRAALQLPSTWIKVDVEPNGLMINSRGYGHGVGMCQYGANGMAQSGQKYLQILRKYYQGVELYKIDY